MLFLKHLEDLERTKRQLPTCWQQPINRSLPRITVEDLPLLKQQMACLIMLEAMTGDDLKEFVDHKLFPYLKKFKVDASPNTIEYKIGGDLSELQTRFLTENREVLNILMSLLASQQGREARDVAPV